MSTLHAFFRSFLLTVLGCVIVSMPAAGQPAEPSPAEVKREQARVDRLWSRAWRDFAPYYVKHDGQYICVPTYDKQLPSSAGLTTREYLKQTAREQEYTDERGAKKKRAQVKPEEEARAGVALLPEAEVGQYGYIHSGNIERIIDGKTLALEAVWLVDAEAIEQEKREAKEEVRKNLFDDIEAAIRNRGRGAREGIMRRMGEENESIDWSYEQREAVIARQRKRVFRDYEWQVIGYRTDKLSEGERWPTGKAAEKGLQVVIIDVGHSTVTAVPTASIGKDLTELDFLNILEKRGVTKAEFVELVTVAKREVRSQYKPLVLSKLEKFDLPDAEDQDEDGNDTVELAD